MAGEKVQQRNVVLGVCCACGVKVAPEQLICWPCSEGAQAEIDDVGGEPEDVIKNDRALAYGYATDEAEDIEAFGGEA